MDIVKLKQRILQIKGLRLVDPWGDTATVWQFDGDTVWLSYSGLHVPFERTLASLVEATNGNLRTDFERQFVKSILIEPGLTLELHYERIVAKK